MKNRAIYSHTEPTLSLERDERTGRIVSAVVVGYTDRDTSGRVMESRPCPPYAIPPNEVRA